jgi:predicted DNA-binding transcriptional regulator AlpA
MSKKYITEKALSAMTGRALQTLRNDRFYNKGFPYIKLGKSVRYDEEEVIALIEKSKITTSSFKIDEVA